MLSLQVNGKKLQLQKQALSIVMSSPLFEGQEPINFSLPFSVPNTPFNQKVLQYPGSLHYHRLPEENSFDFRLYYSGALLFSGIVMLLSCQGGVQFDHAPWGQRDVLILAYPLDGAQNVSGVSKATNKCQ